MSKKYLLLLICFASLKLWAQEDQIDSASSQWNFSAWAEMFIIPGEEDFFNPTFYARHKSLHLEARYNYEDRNTASLWAGHQFKFGKGVKFVSGAHGFRCFWKYKWTCSRSEIEITYKKFDFYSESEYVFDFSSGKIISFYNYSELAITPMIHYELVS